MNALVCEACWTNVFNTEKIQKFWLQENLDFSYYASWDVISCGAGSSCNWCSFLKSVLPSPESPKWPKTWTTSTDLLIMIDKAYKTEGSSPEGLNQCQIDFCSAGVDREWHAEFDLFVDDLNESAGTITARPLQSRVNSTEAFLQIRDWLDECQRHPDCDDVSLHVDLPSRIIEVAPADSPDVPRLRSSKGLQGAYLALSYRWGISQSYVLTSKNLGSLEQKLEAEHLPQTILDAIHVTKRLGFQYLWVDALCIMQDSIEVAAQRDMEQELATMDQVYKNAVMTIVAACASSAMDGFLKDRPDRVSDCFNLPCRLDSKHFIVVHILEHLMYNDTREPVNTRAWTFQEQLLSPRLLIYASHTLQWQCRTTTCNLGGSYHGPTQSSAPRLPSAAHLLLKDPQGDQVTRPINSEIPRPILHCWLNVVRSYSARNSSLPSDKLTALSALAASYAAVFGPKYLAGIWARSPVPQLCWNNSRVTSLTRPKQYRAPSWSWAALDGSVYHPLEPLRDSPTYVPYHRFHVLEWDTCLKVDSLPYGEVTAGTLVVTTVLRDANFDPSRSPSILFNSDQEVFDPHDELNNVTNLLSPDTPPRQARNALSQFDTGEDKFARPVRCLAMYLDKSSEIFCIGGLMLVEAESSLEGKVLYRRMGTFMRADESAFEGHPLETVSII